MPEGRYCISRLVLRAEPTISIGGQARWPQRAWRNWRISGIRLDMQLDLTDEEAAALLSLLNRVIADDRYPLSPRIRLLRAIRGKLPGAPPEPPSARPPTPEERTPGGAPRSGRPRRLMVEGVPTADEVEAALGKWQCRAVAVRPSDVRHFAPRLAQHAERAVEADEPRVRARPRFAICWLPVPHAMSSSVRFGAGAHSAKNSMSSGSADFSRCGVLS
jgi:hypothetical protein